MTTLNKRATVYLDPQIHRLLKLKALETSRSISDIIDEAVRHELLEDEEDLRAFEERAKEPTLSYEAMLKDLRAHGKL